MASFILHSPSEWYGDNFNFTPELHYDRYYVLPDPALNHIGPDTEEQAVYIAHVGDVPPAEMATYNYSSSYLLTQKLITQVPNIVGAKVLVKPNNTGFIGLFYNNPQLREILTKKKGMKEDADHQSIATQPAVVAGVADALLDAGVVEVHIGENMLWDGGTPRAFWETGYTQYFCQEKYDGKVFFVDFYENDDTEVAQLPIAQGEYDLGGYTECYPPQALFDEGYAIIISAAIAKIHNCAYYTLAAKNFSVSWNPRRPMKGIPPRWHIHGLPMNCFTPEYLKQVLGDDFEPVFFYEFKEESLEEGEELAKGPRNVTLCTDTEASDPIRTYMSCGQRVLQVDPHHHAGANLVTLNLGTQYLVIRYTGIFASVVKALNEQGTKVGTICSGIVGQEGEGPLIYGSLRYGGFNLASFNHAGLESIATDIMLGQDASGFAGFLEQFARGREEEYEFHLDEFHQDAQNPWTLELLRNLAGGETSRSKIPVDYFDYSNERFISTLDEVQTLRNGNPFIFTDAFYCSPKTWLRLIHTERGIYEKATTFFQKGVEIPLIPGVVK